MEESRRVRGAGRAGDTEEDPHCRRPGYAAKRNRGGGALPLVAPRRLEERRELPEPRSPEVLEGRHRRARVDARWALQVTDLEVDPLVLRPLRRQVGRAREAPADPLVDVAVGAADDGEQF